MWYNSGTFYQIYPLGFLNCPLENHGEESHKLLDIINWVDYYKELGINCILFNPVFKSSTHGYDTIDLETIDNRLGTNEDFKKVVKNLHENNIRVILDGVFNHVGREFFAFKDLLEKKWDSLYKDWFYIDFNGNSCYNDGFWYEGWEGHFELVKLNLQNPQVIDYLIKAVKIWITDLDIDGIRLDVAYSLDRNFLRIIRRETTALKPDFFLVGEVLFGDYRQIVNDEMLQSCTNYECYKGIHSSLNSMNLFEIAHSLNRQYGPENWCIYRGLHLMNFVDNHDVSRIASILSNKKQIPLAYSLLFTMPGIPCIYYGSEWGELGEKNNISDANLRPAFSEPCKNDLTEYIKKLIKIHENSDAIVNGEYFNIDIKNHQLLFKRKSQNEEVYVGLNISDYDFTFYNDELNGQFEELITGEEKSLTKELKLAPYSTYILRRK